MLASADSARLTPEIVPPNWQAPSTAASHDPFRHRAAAPTAIAKATKG